MNYKLIKNSINYLIFGVICACFMQSCKTNKLLATPSPVMIKETIVKHDTIIRQIPRKKLTNEQVQDYLAPFYQKNFDLLFAPKFNQLNLIIGQQAASIDRLSMILSTTRRRTDSIVKERNYYKENFIRNQEQAIRYQKELIRLQKENFTKNDKQIQVNSLMSISCLIGVAIIAIAFFALYYKVNQLSRKFNSHFKTSSNA